MPLTEVLGMVEQPFPGLRSFEAEESLLFFGREPDVDQILRRLGSSRFLAVVGSSGSGKSSLVRAGLLPALHRGYLAGPTTRWRIAVMRPGNAPLANLCSALSSPGALGPGDEERRRELLSSSSMGLVEAVEDAKLPPGESVLVVVDQFEDLFRYRRQAHLDGGGAEAGLFVSLLLAAAEQFGAPIYVVLTMRSDFLGECAEFPALAEALSRSQYLVPRLTREQRRQAIENPLHLAGTGITTRCLQQALNDWGDEPAADPLPLLQHALARTYSRWKDSGRQGDLDLADYEGAGGLGGALNAHAEAIYSSLDDAGKGWAAKIFRVLITTELGGRIRRPTRLDRLYSIVGAVTVSQRGAVDAVLSAFLKPSNALLVASSPGELRPDVVLDIPHESLITKWSRLDGWARQEALSTEWYMDAARAANLFHRSEGALWGDPNLAHALSLAKSEGWNEDWAAQYRPEGNPGFAEVQGYLESCRKKQLRERGLRWVGLSLIIALLLLAAGNLYFRAQRIEQANRELQNQVTRIQAEQAAKMQDYQKQLQQLSSDKSLTSAQKVQEEQELQAQLASSKAETTKLKAQQDRAANLQKANTDLVAVNRALQDRFANTQARLDSTEKQRQEAINESKTLRDQLGGAVPVQRAVQPRVNFRDGLTYIFIPPGKFTMGCSPRDEECYPDEKPAHEVTITKSFWIGLTPVTQEAYQRVIANNPSHSQGLRLPVETVTWNEAQAYCEAVGLRLPTEAEWEYAARAGSTAARYGSLDRIAWYAANSGGQTHDVSQKQANAFGLDDMLGNVSQWMMDSYSAYPSGSQTDPTGAGNGQYRAVRGGSWISFPRGVRASSRYKNVPSDRSSNIGFRCAGELR